MSVVEALIGRPLRQAEEAIDIVLLDRALAQAKDELDTAIQAEMLRAVERWRDLDLPPILRVTAEMIEPLQDLHDLGVEEAWNERERLGYPARSFAHARESAPKGPGDLAGFLARNLPALTVHIEDEFVRADLSGLAADAIARALLRIPGGRDIASRLVSSALIGGLAQTFEEVADEISCWEYTSVLDGGTCPVCRPLDGTRYETLAQLFVVLPNFGPNPLCLGGGRCRCRAVPCAPGETDVAPPAPEPEPEPEPEPPPEEPLEQLLPIQGGTRGALVSQRAAIEESRDELAKLIRLPDRSFLPDSGVSVTMRRNSSSRGHYKVIQAGGQVTRVEINVGSPAHPTVTFAHEVGHLLDHAYIGKQGRFETSLPTSSWEDDDLGRALSELNDAWEASAAYKTIDAHKGDSLARYMKGRRELWARSFAQWAGLRAGRGALYAETQRDTLAEAAKVAELGDVPGWRQYPEWWQPGDFDRIDAAVTGVLWAAGLLRE